MKDAKNIAITIPTVSYQSKSLIRNTNFIPNAIINIRMIGSPNDPIRSSKKLFLFYYLQVFQ